MGGMPLELMGGGMEQGVPGGIPPGGPPLPSAPGMPPEANAWRYRSADGDDGAVRHRRRH